MRFLFTAGTARGGTNYRTLMLNGHPQIRMSIDPFIPLFRFYRDSLLKSVGQDHLLTLISSSVLDDYYFSDVKLKIMKEIQNANPDIPFDMSYWDELKSSIASRMTLASSDLIQYLGKLPAPSFREVFYNTMKVVTADSDSDLIWAGFNDNWTMEFFPLVAKLIPDAKFMLHLRDPRAVVHSSEFAEPDPAKHPTVLTFARHLRKYYAFATMLPNHPDLEDRILITCYEESVKDPEAAIREMTDFLDVDYYPEMIEVERFRKADGSRWPSDQSVYRSSANIWRDEMPKEMAELTEFICDPEMRLHGYQPEIYDPSVGLSDAAFRFAVKNARECQGWRTDFPEIEQTLGSELYRKRMLTL